MALEIATNQQKECAGASLTPSRNHARPLSEVPNNRCYSHGRCRELINREVTRSGRRMHALCMLALAC